MSYVPSSTVKMLLPWLDPSDSSFDIQVFSVTNVNGITVTQTWVKPLGNYTFVFGLAIGGGGGGGGGRGGAAASLRCGGAGGSAGAMGMFFNPFFLMPRGLMIRVGNGGTGGNGGSSANGGGGNGGNKSSIVDWPVSGLINQVQYLDVGAGGAGGGGGTTTPSTGGTAPGNLAGSDSQKIGCYGLWWPYQSTFAAGQGGTSGTPTAFSYTTNIPILPGLGGGGVTAANAVGAGQTYAAHGIRQARGQAGTAGLDGAHGGFSEGLVYGGCGGNPTGSGTGGRGGDGFLGSGGGGGGAGTTVGGAGGRGGDGIVIIVCG